MIPGWARVVTGPVSSSGCGGGSYNKITNSLATTVKTEDPLHTSGVSTLRVSAHVRWKNNAMGSFLKLFFSLFWLC